MAIHAIFQPELIRVNKLKPTTNTRVKTEAQHTACGRHPSRRLECVDVSKDKDLGNRNEVTCQACLRVIAHDQWAICGYHYQAI